MPDNLHDTQEMLARHHREGAQFAQLMKDTFAGRFNDDFWQDWDQWIEPCLGATPTILDLGTGPGLFLHEMVRRYPGAHAIGVECMPYMIAAAGVLPEGCEIFESDLHQPHLPLAEGSVDAALAAVVIHELNQPLRALQEIHRCLKPGGRLCLLDWVRVPLQQYLTGEDVNVFDTTLTTSQIEDTFIHFVEHNRFSREDLIFLLERCGFKIIASKSIRDGQFARIVAEKC